MKIKVGVVYRSAGQRVDVEAGHKRIGMTSHDVTTGQQTYWFKDGEFDRVKFDLFEMSSPLAKPVPVFRLVEDEVVPVVVTAPVTEDEQETFVPVPKTLVTEPTAATEIPAPVTIPPPPPAAPATLADDIFTALAGRKIRVKDFAAELGLSPEILHDTVSADPRFATITAGWVRAAESPAE